MHTHSIASAVSLLKRCDGRVSCTTASLPMPHRRFHALRAELPSETEWLEFTQSCLAEQLHLQKVPCSNGQDCLSSALRIQPSLYDRMGNVEYNERPVSEQDRQHNANIM